MLGHGFSLIRHRTAIKKVFFSKTRFDLESPCDDLPSVFLQELPTFHILGHKAALACAGNSALPHLWRH